jgi:hypothetical protein
LSMDLDDLIERIVALSALIPNVADASDEIADCPPFADALPFIFVSEGRMTTTPKYAGTVTVTQEYILLQYVQEFKQGDAAGEHEARKACRPYLTSVHRFFLGKPRLELNDNGLNSMNSARYAGNDGPQSASRDGHLYYGIAHRLNVEYEESLD